MTTYGRADLHMHTRASDGLARVADLLAFVQQRGGLDVIAITDHDTLEASLWALEHADQYPFEIVPGLEVTSREGHILGLWITQKIQAGLNLEDTVQAIHEAGGVAVLAHPFHINIDETRRGYQRYWNDWELLARAGFDGIEVCNAASPLPGANVYAAWVARTVGLLALGNSDAHTLNGIGTAQTRFPGKTSADLRQAILQKSVYAQFGMWPPRAYLEYLNALRTGDIQAIDLGKNFEAHV
ncbi:MAG: PHP domain-containing protein [Phototrophicaceae bacterium]